MIWLLLACTPGPDSPAPSLEPPAELTPQAQLPRAEPVPDTIAVRHILLAFEGSKGSPRTPRTRAQAEQLAAQLQVRLKSEDMADLAKEFSDDNGSAARGGWLGAGQRETWVPEFSGAAFGLQVGQVSATTESPFGLHIIQRVALNEVHLRQILVQHSAVPRVWLTDPEQSRSSEQALELAQSALAELVAGVPFEQVAQDYSDDPMAQRGGDLGLFLQGELGPAFDQVAMDLEPGERSGVFETTLGYHILERSD